jgi:mannose-6-phosphate isomerase-like protein (cupin superfamily)
MTEREISIERAASLLKESGHVFTEVFTHGTLSVEFYKPENIDLQKPHDRDEIYVVASGTGVFYNGGKTWNFKPGDFLFVPAGVEHRFENFTDDFATWVFFYGPVGGEKESMQ